MKVRHLIPLLVLALISSCETIDCTLNNTVSYTCNFYSDGSQVSLNDALNVTACGTDSVLINNETGAKSMKLDMSFWNPVDTLVMQVSGTDYVMFDTIWIAKDNIAHFESPDCPTKMFHRITSVWSTHTFIDSINVVQPNINYDEVENLQIHFYSNN